MTKSNVTSIFFQKHSLIIGIGLMFLLTWPIDLANSGIINLKLPFIVYLFLGWGFVIAAIIMTGISEGHTGVIRLLKRYLLWRISWKWYLAAFFLCPVLILGGIYLSAAFTHVPPNFNAIFAKNIFRDGAVQPILVLPFFLFEFISNGEEIGWRGYILPRLQTKFNALASSLILGVIWGFWHLPKYLSSWNPTYFAWFIVHILAFSVLLTWLSNHTKGSLLLVTIFHAASNTAAVFLPVSFQYSEQNIGAFIFFVLSEVVVALLITISAGTEKLTRKEIPVGENA